MGLYGVYGRYQVTHTVLDDFLCVLTFSSFSLLVVYQVRLSVLQSLTSEFDRYLARAQHVSTLLLLLADEVR